MQRQTTVDTEQEKTMNKFGNSNIPNQNEINELIERADNSDEYWENIIDCSETEFIDEYLFEYLYKNNICLEKLAHLQLNDKHLKKLSADYEEAFITLAVRYFVSENYSILEFIQLLKECKYKSVFEILYFITDNLTEKLTVVNHIISENRHLSTEFKVYSNKLYRSKLLMFSDKEKILTDAFEENEPEYMLSLSKNINTPEYILNKLTSISGIKYASKIRNNSRKTLEYKKQT